jgi:hypothetical protein
MAWRKNVKALLRQALSQASTFAKASVHFVGGQPSHPLSLKLQRARNKTRLQLTLACQPKPWRRLVEVPGIEPGSEDHPQKASTCLYQYLF